MKTFRTLFKTELKLSLRGMDMVIFAIIMPLIILVVLGLIYGDKPAFDNAPYSFLEQSFGALTAISICAGGLMGLPLVVSDYRSKGILKRFHVTPVKPLMILWVQLCIYALYSWVSLVLLYGLSSLFFGFSMKGSVFEFLLGWLLVMISMFSMGMMVGGLAKNSKIAGAIASLLYFPMLIFSGTTLPYEVMPRIMQKASDLLPLTQGIKILKASTLGLPIGDVFLPVIVMVVLALVCSVIAVKGFRWE